MEDKQEKVIAPKKKAAGNKARKEKLKLALRNNLQRRKAKDAPDKI